MRRLAPIAVLLAGCGAPGGLCGDGLEPVVVTGLSGVLEGAGPALEVQHRVPDTCEVLDDAWIFFDDATQTLSIGDAPTEGTLRRDRIQVEDRLVFFTDFNVGAELLYPDDAIGPTLTLAWTTGRGEAIGVVECRGADGALSCAEAP